MVRGVKKTVAILLIIMLTISYLPTGIIDQLKGAMVSNAVSGFWEYGSGTTTWTAPYTGYYDIYCYGSQGGNTYAVTLEKDSDSHPSTKPTGMTYTNGGNGSLRASRAFIKKGTVLTINTAARGNSMFHETRCGWKDRSRT